MLEKKLRKFLQCYVPCFLLFKEAYKGAAPPFGCGLLGLRVESSLISRSGEGWSTESIMIHLLAFLNLFQVLVML